MNKLLNASVNDREKEEEWKRERGREVMKLLVDLIEKEEEIKEKHKRYLHEGDIYLRNKSPPSKSVA